MLTGLATSKNRAEKGWLYKNNYPFICLRQILIVYYSINNGNIKI